MLLSGLSSDVAGVVVVVGGVIIVVVSVGSVVAMVLAMRGYCCGDCRDWLVFLSCM